MAGQTAERAGEWGDQDGKELVSNRGPLLSATMSSGSQLLQEVSAYGTTKSISESTRICGYPWILLTELSPVKKTEAQGLVL